MIAALLTVALAAAPHELPIPRLERTQLSNGLTVIAFEKHAQPIAIAQLAVFAGAQNEPAGKTGLSDVVAGLMGHGTRHQPADAMLDWLDAHGATLAADAGDELTVISASGLASDFDVLLGMLADTAVTPALSAQELQRLMPQLEADARDREDDPGHLADMHLDALLYGSGHPFGRAVTPESLKAIRREDVVAFHHHYYRPNRAVLVITGDFDARAAVDKARIAFGAWEPRPEPPLPAAPDLNAPRVRIVDRPELSQTQIRIAFAAPPRGSPEEIPLEVVNEVLGGGFTSRLMDALRTTGGKTYDVSTSVSATSTTGDLLLSTSTRNKEVGATVKRAVELMIQLRDEGPTAEELERTRGQLGRGALVKLSSLEALLHALLDQEAFQRGENYVRSYRQRIEAVDLMQAQEVSRRILWPGPFAAVFVGNAKEIAEQVRDALPGTKVEVVGEDAPITAPALPPKPTVPSTGASALALLREATAAAGGDKVVGAIAGVTADGQLKRLTDGKEVLAIRDQARNASLWRRTLSHGEQVVEVTTLTPNRAFALRGGGEQALPAAEAEDLRLERTLSYPAVLLLPQRKDLVLIGPDDEVIKDGTRSGLPASVVEVRRSSDGTPLARVFFDRKSHLPAGYTRKLPDGRQQLVRWLEFDSVEGLQFPMKERTLVGGQATSEISWIDVTLGPVPDSAFQ